MAKPGKIEKYGLEEFVTEQINKDRDITDVALARFCNEELACQGIKDTITNMAIKRFRERETEKKVEVIKADKRRLQKAVNQEFDIIQSQISLCNKMFLQLDEIEQFPDRVDRHYEQLIDDLERLGNPLRVIDRVKVYLERHKKDFQNYIYELAAVSKEIRENNKFMVDLTAKVHEYNLVQEYIRIFIEEFRKENPETCNNVLDKLAANPRLRRLVLEHQAVTGGGK
ncbi:MAG: hypothetical protein ACYDG6_06760 [Thermincolia bacterium]